MKKITIEQWKSFVSNNCDISYSLVVCFTILEIWEASCKTKEEATEVIMKNEYGLSGFQAENVINFALKHEIPDWLDKGMVDICSPKDSQKK